MIGKIGLSKQFCTRTCLGFFVVAFWCWMEPSALAAATAIALSPGAATSVDVPQTLAFPVARTGDAGYDVVVGFHTEDGSAFAGTDYTAAAGTFSFGAGSTTENVPVTIAANTSATTESTFRLVLDSATGVGPAPVFALKQDFQTGKHNFAVTTADINGDGKPDTVVANDYNDTVSVFLNATEPGSVSTAFTAESLFATGHIPYSVVGADMNGDGRPDLIVANQGESTISVLVNTTLPGSLVATFAPQQVFDVQLGPWMTAVADINRDGKPDILSANASSATLSILRNTTKAGAMKLSFAPQQTIDTLSLPVGIAAADINGDGATDVIVISVFRTSFSVLLNDTLPGADALSFDAAQTFSTADSTDGYGASSVIAADINGDGRPDIVVTNELGYGSVSVLANTTEAGSHTASFAQQRAFATGTAPFSADVKDLNGDGKPDLAIANSGVGNVSILINSTPDGSLQPDFEQQQMVAAGPGSVSVSATDLNGDGRVDLAVANSTGGTFSALVNTTASGGATLDFSPPTSLVAGGLLRAGGEIVDVNSDGRPDLIVPDSANDTVAVLLNTTAAGATSASFGEAQPFDAGADPISVAAGDFNLDGRPDLIIANSSTSSISVLLNTTSPGVATSSYAPRQEIDTGCTPHSIATGDLNGDGKPDVVVICSNTDSVAVIFDTSDPGSFAAGFSSPHLFDAGQQPVAIALRDINGDGKIDLLVSDQSGTVSVLLNDTATGASVPALASPQSFASGLQSGPIAAADINSDGKPDIVVGNNQDSSGPGAISILINQTPTGSATVTFSGAQPFGTLTGPNSLAIVDLDGDGKPDIAAANLLNASAISVLINTTAPGASSSSFLAQQPFATHANPGYVTVADVNGDGRPDLIAASYDGSGIVSVLLNTQYKTLITGSPATGTILRDSIFANGFD